MYDFVSLDITSFNANARTLLSKPDEIKMLMTCVLDCNNHKNIQHKYATYKSIVHLKKKRNDVKSRQVFFLSTLFQQVLHFYTPLQDMILWIILYTLYVFFCYIFSSYFPLYPIRFPIMFEYYTDYIQITTY